MVSLVLCFIFFQVSHFWRSILKASALEKIVCMLFVEAGLFGLCESWKLCGKQQIFLSS